MMKVRQKSSWDEAEIADYLKKTVIPMRIAITDGDFPRFDCARGLRK